MLVLGIETSCDETALSLVADGRHVLANEVTSSLKEHQRYGGVVPEIASRAHVNLITYQLEALLEKARVHPAQIDRIAVTFGPGLAGSLLIGIAAAKALGLAWGKPVVGVNHLQAHLYAALMGDTPWPLEERMVGLVVSGGHTALIEMEGIHRMRLLGQTRDDAVGEAFDKVAKLLGLGFPGGPEIERTAVGGNPKAHRFLVARMKDGSDYDFSFSGIKTAVLHKVREFGNGQAAQALPAEAVADLAASFQESVVEELVGKVLNACRRGRIQRLIVGGGVIANRRLRERLKELCADFRIALGIPSLGLCTDNGAMVAGLAAQLIPGEPLDLTARPNLAVESFA